MDLNEKFQTLLILLESFLKKEVTTDKLVEFAWSVIDYFSDTSPDKLPEVHEFEREFWFAIWQIQHLCDEDHIADGAATSDLGEALSYLKKEKTMPQELIGKRP